MIFNGPFRVHILFKKRCKVLNFPFRLYFLLIMRTLQVLMWDFDDVNYFYKNEIIILP